MLMEIQRDNIHLQIICLLYDECVKNTWLLETAFIVIGNMKVCMMIRYIHHSVTKKLENDLQMLN